MSTARARNWPYGEFSADEPVPQPRRRRKSLRHRFCDGIEAAVRAEPAAFAATKPRTMMGLIVRELVCTAASARCSAIKLVTAYLSEAEMRRMPAEVDSQGISEADQFPETKWDWDEDGNWDASEPESEPGPGSQEPRETEETRATTEAPRAKAKECFLHAAKADRVNDARKAQPEAERERRNAPPAAPISGNFSPPAARNQPIGAMRIGGRLLEGRSSPTHSAGEKRPAL